MRQRLEYIDSLRGFAALYVVIHHVYTAVFGIAPVLSSIAIVPTLFMPFLYGRAGVDLFLVLSGFVLYMPLVNGERASESYLRFMFRRAWRILPPYYVAIGMTLLALTIYPRLGVSMPYSAHITLRTILTHLALVNNLGTADDLYGINYPLWTIPLEFQLYAVFPVLALLVARWGPLRSAVAAIAATLFSRWLFGHVGAGYLMNSVPGYASVFTCGIAAAHASVKFAGQIERYRRSLALFAMAMLGLGILSWTTRVAFLLPDTCWGIGFACIVLALNETGKAPMALLGRFSYSLYLVHAPLLAIALILVVELHLSAALEFGVLLLVGVPCIVAAAYVFHWLFERPFLRRPPPYLMSGPAPAPAASNAQ